MLPVHPVTEAANPQTECPLFRLPPELRNEIYVIVLTVPSTPCGTLQLTPKPKNPEKPTVLSFLQTCRILRDEAQGIFYSIHNIELRQDSIAHPEFLNGQQLGDFLRRLNPGRLYAIHQITITGTYWENFTSAMKQLPRLRNLQVLYLEIDDPGNGGWRDFPRKEFEREVWHITVATRKLPASLTRIKVRTSRSGNAAHLTQKTPHMEWAEKLEDVVNRALERRRTSKEVVSMA